MSEDLDLDILALSTSYPLRHGSTAGVFIQRLYAHLSASRVVVLCPADDRPSQDSTDGHIRLQPVRYAPQRWRRLAQQAGGVAPGIASNPALILMLPLLLGSLWLKTWTGARRASLIHANWAVCGAIAVVAGKLSGRPVVTTLRGDDVSRSRRSWFERMLLQTAVKGSCTVVCVSVAMAATLRETFPAHAHKVAVCENGVDETFLDVPRNSPASNVMRIAAVGSLIPRKAFDVLLSAVAVASHAEHLQLSIIGAGPERKALGHQASALGIADRVRFVGEVSPAAMPAALAEFDILVMSSRSEGRPNVVMEALAAGLPVISTALPGVIGLVDDGVTGWLVNVDDSHGLARALDEAAANAEERQRRGVAARERMQSDGGWSRTAKEYEAIFRRAALAKGNV